LIGVLDIDCLISNGFDEEDKKVKFWLN